MKLNDVKHNHSLTDLLKILIFSILMMIPFIDVGIRCAYVVCNKNAYQSYSGSTYEKAYINTNDVPLEDVYYSFNGSIAYGSGERKELTFSNAEYITGNLTTSQASTITTDIVIQVWYDSNLQDNYVTWTGLGTNLSSSSRQFTIKGDLVGTNVFVNSQSLNNNLVYRENNVGSTLDNVFDYSVNKLTTSELYTWTQQTAIYTGVQTMCAQLGINNTVIPLLLVYWFILTIIYIIIDIVLKLFTMLTHAIGSKTA